MPAGQTLEEVASTAETAGLTELAAVGREDYSDATNTAYCEHALGMLLYGIVSETGTDTGTGCPAQPHGNPLDMDRTLQGEYTPRSGAETRPHTPLPAQPASTRST